MDNNLYERLKVVEKNAKGIPLSVEESNLLESMRKSGELVEFEQMKCQCGGKVYPEEGYETVFRCSKCKKIGNKDDF